MVRRAAAVIAGALFLAGCGAVNGPPGQDVPINKIAEGNVEGVSNLQIAVPVTTADKWWEEWQTIHIADNPLPAPPVIDFTKQHVIIVGSHLGKGDYSMNVSDISVSGDTAHVTLDAQEVASDCPESAFDVLPFQAYTVPPAVTKLSISEHDQTLNCR